MTDSFSATAFKYLDGEYHCENIPLTDLVEKYDSPLYVYSRSHMLNQLQKFQQVFNQQDSLVCFAVKSNSNLAVLQLLAEAGAGFDIVSGGELERVLKVGADPNKIVYSGVGKTAAEQRRALEAGICQFNVESVPEIEQLQRQAKELQTEAQVAIRVNPAVDAKTHAKITTGKKENKFGIPFPEVESVANRIAGSKNLNFVGLHFHIGSQITDPEPFKRLAAKARDLVRSLRDHRLEVETLNLGGGLGVCYEDEETLSPECWWEIISPYLADLDLKFIVEPGRFITANAGALITRVTYVKKSVTHNFIVVDTGMNSLIRPAMYEAYHRIVPVIPRNNEPIKADVVGPVCETGDYFGKERQFPEPRPGDLLAVMSAGAYGACMASHYNSFPRPAELLVDGSSAHLIRERDRYEDIWEKEKMINH